MLPLSQIRGEALFYIKQFISNYSAFKLLSCVTTYSDPFVRI